jgi:nitrite reductase/ring-hydroxylating ferredoxin subunit
MMAEFVKVAKTDEITPGRGKTVQANGNKVALFNVEGAFYAIGDTCTHHGGPLSEGSLDGKLVTCPWHGAIFGVTTGEALGAPAHGGAPRCNVRVDGSEIEVEV